MVRFKYFILVVFFSMNNSCFIFEFQQLSLVDIPTHIRQATPNKQSILKRSTAARMIFIRCQKVVRHHHRHQTYIVRNYWLYYHWVTDILLRISIYVISVVFQQNMFMIVMKSIFEEHSSLVVVAFDAIQNLWYFQTSMPYLRIFCRNLKYIGELYWLRAISLPGSVLAQLYEDCRAILPTICPRRRRHTFRSRFCMQLAIMRIS